MATKKKKVLKKKKKTVSKKAPKKKTLKNYIAFVLDSSGSMVNIRDEAISFFNEQLSVIKDQKEMSNKITLTTFATTVHDSIYKNKKPVNVENLTRESYNPNGWTALNDAIAKTIGDLETFGDETDKDTSFLVVIITDGMENWSTEFKGDEGRKALKQLIETKQEMGNWTFTFLGANQDVVLTQKELGLHSGNTMSFASSKVGVEKCSLQTRSAVDTYFNARLEGQTSVNNFYNDSDSTTKEKSENE